MDRVELLLLLDSPPPCRYPPLPMSTVDWIFSSDDIPTPPTLSKRLVAHFEATVDSLAAYGNPGALVLGAPLHVVIITAKQGINVSKPDDSNHPTVSWLINPRTGLGTNGWEEHLPGCDFTVHEIDANHFNMIHPPCVSALAERIKASALQ